ncbi:MAG: hypothetical protein KH100_15260 [Dysgonomonas mossii]|uniref:hypothetical protein n=1 Tax=Dysgonomonas mossii TaxID=163665 RepID=UPI001D475F8B|nr:hypothetical protein [Dysgonomonas mossii]MBS5798045.1 hypothetical protein [Dysgonomonas mossii]MBS7112541.1 hypothetical protein [Dysgonomonas mossii]
MEGFYLFIGIVIIVFGILQIILFFKIWGMTNDIREIRNQYINKSETYNTNDDIIINKSVKHKVSGKILIAKFYDNDTDKYVCYSEQGTFENRFSKDDLIFLED